MTSVFRLALPIVGVALAAVALLPLAGLSNGEVSSQQSATPFRAYGPMLARDFSPPTATPTPFPPTPTPVPQPTGIRVRNTSWYTSSTGSIWVVGEVYNGLAVPVEFVKVSANFYSPTASLLATDYSYSDVGTMPAGSDSPFSVLLIDPPAGIASVAVQVSDYDTDVFFPPAVGLSATISNVYRSSIGSVHVVGTAFNAGPYPHEFVKVFVAFYLPDGRVWRTDFTYVDPDDLGAGASGTFDVLFFSAPAGMESAPKRIWIDGDRD